MKQKLRILAGLCCITFMVHGQYVLEGVVSDAASHQKLLGVAVYFPELQKGTVTDTSGHYRIQGIPGGRFTVQYSHMGYETSMVPYQFNQPLAVLDQQLKVLAIESQEVIVTGGRTATQHENAIKIEQVRKTVLESAVEGNLIKKLARVPGIDVVTKGSGIAFPVIRGLSTANLVVLNNGVRLEHYQFSTNHPYLVSEDQVQNVEISKGPASLLYGSDAVGGVINFLPYPPASVNSVHARWHSEYSTNGGGYSYGAAVDGSRENWFGGLQLGQSSSMDFRDGAGARVINSRYTAYSMQAKSGMRLRNGLFRFDYQYNQFTPGLVIPQALSEVTSTSYQNQYWYQNLHNHLLTSNTSLFYGPLKIYMDWSYQQNERQLCGSGSTPAFNLVDMGLKSVTGQLKARYQFSERSDAVWVYQGMWQENRNATAPQRVLPDYVSESHAMAALWQYALTPEVFYQLGFRYDYKRYRISAQLDTNGNYHFDELNRSYTNWSFSTGTTWKVLEFLLFRANIASAYRTPTMAELTQDGIHANRYEQGNSNLKNQRNVEGDISIHVHREALKIDLAGFYNRLFNYIDLMPTHDSTPEGLQLYQYRQQDATLYGWEAETEWRPVSVLGLQGSYAHVLARQNDGGYLPFIPQDKIQLNLSLRREKMGKWHQLEAAINPVYAFGQHHPHAFEEETPGYLLLHALIQAKVHLNKTTLQLGVYASNLLNTVYYDHLSTIHELGFYDTGRSVRFKLGVVW